MLLLQVGVVHAKPHLEPRADGGGGGGLADPQKVGANVLGQPGGVDDGLDPGDDLVHNVLECVLLLLVFFYLFIWAKTRAVADIYRGLGIVL